MPAGLKNNKNTINMKKEELKIVLQSHKLWANGEGGQCAYMSCADLRDADLSGADLRCADMSGADMSGANLRRADMSGADMSGANLSGANLRDANMSGANLRRANLRDADMSGANLRRANLRRANLRRANLRRANLSGANLSGANLRDIKFDELTAFFAISCPIKGAFVGFKKIKDKIVELEIQADARRSSATSRKCRCEFAKVLSITNLDGSDAEVDTITNDRYISTVYTVGEMVYPDKWDDDRWNECSHGIHFFITREEAVNYE